MRSACGHRGNAQGVSAERRHEWMDGWRDAPLCIGSLLPIHSLQPRTQTLFSTLHSTYIVKTVIIKTSLSNPSFVDNDPGLQGTHGLCSWPDSHIPPSRYRSHVCVLFPPPPKHSSATEDRPGAAGSSCAPEGLWGLQQAIHLLGKG